MANFTLDGRGGGSVGPMPTVERIISEPSRRVTVNRMPARRVIEAMSRFLSALMIVSVSSGAPAQQRQGFEAASVKRHLGLGGGFLGRQPGGRFTADGVSLRDLIVFAYGV